MKIKVNKHNLELIETPVNELEVNVTKIEFEFDEDMQDMVKEAYFTLNNHSYKVIIQNNECNIPSEVLTQKGNIEIGVVCFEVQDEETIKRYNPSPVYISTWSGSLKEADNTEPITPTDKEQIEQQLLDISNEMDNLNIEAEKVEHTTTITITRKDGTSYDVQVLDGEKGEQGEPGVPGAVKFIIVQTLPTENIDESAIYLVPSDDPTTQDLYLEYMYINNQWELLGQKQIVVDLTDYVKFTDTAGPDKAGVMKVTNGGSGFIITNGFLRGYSHNYQTYVNAGNDFNIAKGTLEAVLTARIGDIASVIDAINGESI